MQRIDSPQLLGSLLETSTAPATITSISGPNLPAWTAGQLLTGQVLENLDGQVVILIDGLRLLAEWPENVPPAGRQVQLRVLGKAENRWQLARVLPSVAQVPESGAALLELLAQLDLRLSYQNVINLRHILHGRPTEIKPDAQSDAHVLCPPNVEVWQQVLGLVPVPLAAVFFTWQPFVCGLFIAEDHGKQIAGDPADEEAFNFLLTLDLPHLGQIEVIGRGDWPEQSLFFLARQETALLLQKTEERLIALLAKNGLKLRNLTVRSSDEPLLLLVRPEMLPRYHVDRLV